MRRTDILIFDIGILGTAARFPLRLAGLTRRTVEYSVGLALRWRYVIQKG